MDETTSMLCDLQERFLRERYGEEARAAIVRGNAGWSSEIWNGMAELGLLGALLPEAQGGIGCGPEALMGVMERFGRALLIEPFVNIALVGGELFGALGNEDALGKIAAGEFRPLLAHQRIGQDATYGVTAGPGSQGGFLLSARRPFVVDNAPATHVVLAAAMADGGQGLFLVPAESFEREDVARLIDGRSVATLICDALPLPADALLLSGDAVAPLVERLTNLAIVATCGEAVGVMRAMLEATTDYTRQRTQFGQPISTFQVLQHRMVEMLVEIEQAQSLTWCAAHAVQDNYAVSAAKAGVDAALLFVAHAAVQLHGGIGTTYELNLAHYFRRATTIRALLGSSSEHFARLEAGMDRGATSPMRRRAGGIADLLLSEADIAFRAEVRAFLDRAFTPEMRAEADRQSGVFAQPDLARRWQAVLYAQGWAAPSWPKEHGGTGWTTRQRLIFECECALANTPVLPAMGLQMCGPVLMAHGTDEQKSFFLPRILSGEHSWCQGYSEPAAGSDLASLKCRMERDGDDYVLNGTKIWTTYAHAANWMFLLARSDLAAKPQAGISFLLVPMDSPGITVTPILSMSGEHEVNQVFLDNVRVPAGNLVGQENQGWGVAKFLLEFERGGGDATARSVRVIGMIQRLAARLGGLSPDLLRRLARLEIDITATDWTQKRMLAHIETGRSVGNAAASILKLKASELYQGASLLFMDALGETGLIDQREAIDEDLPAIGSAMALTGSARYMNSRAMSIFGGTNEIQRSILARQALRL